jgi:hypothetical protein
MHSTLGVIVTVYSSIQDIPCPNTGRAIGYPDIFRGFTQFPHANTGITPRPYRSKFFAVYQLLTL